VFIKKPSSWGSQLGALTSHHQSIFLAPLPGRKKISARGVSHAQSFTMSLFCFTLLLFASFYQKYKKNSFFIVAFTCLLLVLLEWVLLRTPSYVTLLAPKQ
jgi:hypothetical protein